jgi:transcription elongation factor S-II
LESIYADKLNQLLCILNSDKLESILKSLKNKDFEAKTLAFLKPEELNPEKFEKIIKKKELEEHKKNNKATTNAFKCSKCGKRKCVVEEKQIRSGDEPATVFVECKECGHKFTF